MRGRDQAEADHVVVALLEAVDELARVAARARCGGAARGLRRAARLRAPLRRRASIGVKIMLRTKRADARLRAWDFDGAGPRPLRAALNGR